MRIAAHHRIVGACLWLGLMLGCGSGLEGDTSRVEPDTRLRDTLDADDGDDADIASDVPEIPDIEEVHDADAEVDVPEDSRDETLPDISDTSDAGEVEADVPTPWRSALYPVDWQPGFSDPATGAMLQDYSYAGYHNGEAPLGAGLGPNGPASLARFDVTTYGATPTADPLMATDSTDAFQAAIDAARAAGGGLVFVPAGIYRIDAWLTVGSSRIVIQGEGPAASRLWFTRKVGMSQSAHLRFIGSETVTTEVPLVHDAVRLDNTVAVADASAFNIGEDVVIGQPISEAFLAARGMTRLWSGYLGQWQPFYRRTIVGIDRASQPNLVRLDVPLRGGLDVSDGASLRRVSGLIREVALQDIGIANAVDWETAWGGDEINAITFAFVADGWVKNVASWVSPGAPTSGFGQGAHLQSSGLLVANSKRFTVADCRLDKAQNRSETGNGFLFEVRQSNEVLTRDSSAREGRTNFTVGRGFGTSGCVWLRVSSAAGASVPLGPMTDQSIPARSEMHTLATANLVDACDFEDSFDVVVRGLVNNGSGHSATESVFWNFAGREVISLQYGLGYVIGSKRGTRVSTSLLLSGAVATEPEDWVEGLNAADLLVPTSLYEDQLARRLGNADR